MGTHGRPMDDAGQPEPCLSSLLARSYGAACAAAEAEEAGGLAQAADGSARLAHLLRCSLLLSLDPATRSGSGREGQVQQVAKDWNQEWQASSRVRERVDDMLRTCARF
jgi:hypothetical protein